MGGKNKVYILKLLMSSSGGCYGHKVLKHCSLEDALSYVTSYDDVNCGDSTIVISNTKDINSPIYVYDDWNMVWKKQSPKDDIEYKATYELEHEDIANVAECLMDAIKFIEENCDDEPDKYKLSEWKECVCNLVNSINEKDKFPSWLCKGVSNE